MLLPGPKAATNAATPILYPTLSRNCRRVPSLSLSRLFTHTHVQHSRIVSSLSLSFFLYLFPFCHIIRPSVARWTFLPRSKRFHLRSLVSSLHSRREIKKKRASGNSLQQGASSYRCCRLRTYVLKRPFFPPFYLPYKVVNEISRSVVVCVCVCAHRPPPVCTGRDEDLSWWVATFPSCQPPFQLTSRPKRSAATGRRWWERISRRRRRIERKKKKNNNSCRQSCSNVNSPKVSILRKEGARNRNCYGKKRKKKSGREREREKKKAEVL